MALQPISVRGGLGLAYQPFTREIAASVVGPEGITVELADWK